jgi:hypothetical protein
VPLFRRREPLHVRLAREGGLVDETPVSDPRPPFETGIHGLQRAREWDATVTADAPDVAGDALQFVVLPDKTLLVEDGPDDVSFEPLAAAVEQTLAPPYRARAVRQSETLWAVQARRIEVVEIRNGPDGDSIELTPDELLVDGARTFGSIPELENRGDVVRAERLDGDLWEVRAAAL